MRPTLAVLILVATSVASAQQKFTVDQRVAFTQSSIQPKHEDRQVALKQRLTESVAEDLQGARADPKTGPVAILPPSEEEQQKVLEKVRDYAADYTKHLPDFICTQVTRRYVSETRWGAWGQPEVITARLSFFGQREDYKVISVSGRPGTREMYKLGGVISRGEFGTQLKMLFAPGCRARFAWKRWAKLRNRRMHVYSYSIQRANSQWHIKHENRNSTVIGYSGLIYVDNDTKKIAKITGDSNDIPPTLPILKAWTQLDYDFVALKGSEYLLPLRSQTYVRTGRQESRIDIEFRDYRKFGSESTISFDTPEPLPKERTEERPIK
ncbi:MAG: hypothetical protein ABFD86_08205 [Bryobacteraceae bacterium]